MALELSGVAQPVTEYDTNGLFCTHGLEVLDTGPNSLNNPNILLCCHNSAGHSQKCDAGRQGVHVSALHVG